MKDQLLELDPTLSRLKHLVVDKFQLSADVAENLTLNEPLFAGSLGLDAMDVLELAMYVEDEFDLKSGSATESQATLASIASLAYFVRRQARTVEDLPPLVASFAEYP